MSETSETGDARQARDARRRTFNGIADLYEQARPAYPPELFDDLVALAGLEPGDRLLEIGCATGLATLPLLERGFEVVCVELGSELADRARRKFAGLSAELHVTPFETWVGKPESFALVYAATAWHWIDPEIRYRKAHELLRPGGHLAFWSAMHAFPAGFDSFFDEIQTVYEELGESREAAWPPAQPADMYDHHDEIEQSGLFEDVQVRRYLWEMSYTAEQYVALVNTYSNHIAMENAKRERLIAEIRRRICNRPAGRIRRHWISILHVARVVQRSASER